MIAPQPLGSLRLCVKEVGQDNGGYSMSWPTEPSVSC